MTRPAFQGVGTSALAAFAFVTACVAELPDCPPGTDFEDCKPSGITNTPALGPRAGAGGSPSVSTSTGGAGGRVMLGGSGGSEGPPPLVLSMPDAGATPVTAPDTCPNDPKTAPGVCGCAVPDDNFDGDGAVDCLDDCPDNAARTLPSGPCGCSALTDTVACTGLRDAIRNLYTFDGTGTSIVDSENAMNGTLADSLGTLPLADLQKLQVNGRLNLDGASTFVDLPDGLISSLTSATFEVWTTWRGGAAWQRIFDFGDNDGGGGLTYLFLTPANSINGNLRVAYSVAGPGAAETLVDGLGPLAAAGAADRTMQHLAVVIDDAAGAMRLYGNGLELGQVALAGDLAAINDGNTWLGRSNFPVDPPFFGSLVEFRIYDQALSAAQISTSFQGGPGALN